MGGHLAGFLARASKSLLLASSAVSCLMPLPCARVVHPPAWFPAMSGSAAAQAAAVAAAEVHGTGRKKGKEKVHESRWKVAADAAANASKYGEEGGDEAGGGATGGGQAVFPPSGKAFGDTGLVGLGVARA